MSKMCIVKLLPHNHKLKNRIKEHGDIWRVKNLAKPAFTDKPLTLIEAEDGYLMWVEPNDIISIQHP